MRSEAKKKTDAKYRQTERGKAACTREGIKYRQTEKGKVAHIREHAKRKELGFEMINDWFPESHGHHIDKKNVLFIPAELHNSIKHRQDDLESMQRMNDAAFEWFYIEEVI